MLPVPLSLPTYKTLVAIFRMIIHHFPLFRKSSMKSTSSSTICYDRLRPTLNIWKNNDRNFWKTSVKKRWNWPLQKNVSKSCLDFVLSVKRIMTGPRGSHQMARKRSVFHRDVISFRILLLFRLQWWVSRWISHDVRTHSSTEILFEHSDEDQIWQKFPDKIFSCIMFLVLM